VEAIPAYGNLLFQSDQWLNPAPTFVTRRRRYPQVSNPINGSTLYQPLSPAGVGTHSYCAPEQLAGGGLYGPPADVYPLGLLLLELACPFGTGALALHCLNGNVVHFFEITDIYSAPCT
jgi:serine/threonine protein kinase